ncbi:MAG TPA: transglycosylase family protein [Acidimicrobiia bacterium]
MRPPLLTARRRLGPAQALGAVVAAAAVLALGAAPLGAQTTGNGASSDPSVASLRQQADQASTAYFGALDHYQALTAQIGALQAELPALQAEEAARTKTALARAVAAYEGAGSQQLGALIGSGSVLAAAQQAEWLSVLNGQDNRALTALRQSETKLRGDEKTLQAAQQDAAGALATLQAQGAAIEAKLTAAQTQANQAAAAAAAATAAPQGGGGGSAPAAPAGGGNPSYAPSPGENPHHNDPFLVCTRDRESGGDYGAVNPSGPYLGAYQFLQATWDSTANHAGRGNLIGVPPNTASEYDQDDIAWDLYQWQGTAPWGGNCG